MAIAPLPGNTEFILEISIGLTLEFTVRFIFVPSILHFRRCCSTERLLFCVFCNVFYKQNVKKTATQISIEGQTCRLKSTLTFQMSAMSCCDAFKSAISMHMTKNLSLFRWSVSGPDWRTTLIVMLVPGARMPVLGRTRNFSGDVVFI